MSGVDFYSFDVASGPQGDHDPFVTGFAAPPGFPAVPYIGSAPRCKDHPGVAVMDVVIVE